MHARTRVDVIPQTPQPRRDVDRAGVSPLAIPQHMPQAIPQGRIARARAPLSRFKPLKKNWMEALRG